MKSLIALIFAVLAFTAKAQPFSPRDRTMSGLLGQLNSTNSNVNLTTGLLAYWKFDESSGATASDSNGGTNTLTYPSPPPTMFFTGGHTGNYYTNAGSYGLSNMLAKGLPAFGGTVHGSSYSFWINLPPSPSGYFYGEAGAASANYYPEFRVSVSSARHLSIDIYDDAGNTVEGLTSGGLLPTNVWTHVVLTYDTAGNHKVYTNNVVDASISTITIAGRTFTANVSGVGSYYNQGAWQGATNIRVDEFRIYNIVLTTNQVAALYAQ